MTLEELQNIIEENSEIIDEMYKSGFSDYAEMCDCYEDCYEKLSSAILDYIKENSK